VALPFAERARSIAPIRRLLLDASLACAAVTVVLQIGYPLVAGTARDRITLAIVIAFSAAVIGHAAATLGRHGVLAVAAAGGLGFAAEVFGVHSGIPFGRYEYSNTLGPRLAGVPIVVGLAWAMMAWPAALAARRLARSGPARIAIGAWALAAWDLFLDPQQVADGHWMWRQPSPHLPGVADVPLTNLLGWVLVATVCSATIQHLVAERPVHPDEPMVGLYLWTYASSGLALAAFLGLGAAAAWGALGMGLIAVPLAGVLVRSR
jgi:uncharacterized membrane protein